MKWLLSSLPFDTERKLSDSLSLSILSLVLVCCLNVTQSLVLEMKGEMENDDSR